MQSESANCCIANFLQRACAYPVLIARLRHKTKNLAGREGRGQTKANENKELVTDPAIANIYNTSDSLFPLQPARHSSRHNCRPDRLHFRPLLFLPRLGDFAKVKVADFENKCAEITLQLCGVGDVEKLWPWESFALPSESCPATRTTNPTPDDT